MSHPTNPRAYCTVPRGTKAAVVSTRGGNRGACPDCGRHVRLNKNGVLAPHGPRDEPATLHSFVADAPEGIAKRSTLEIAHGVVHLIEERAQLLAENTQLRNALTSIREVLEDMGVELDGSDNRDLWKRVRDLHLPTA